jgi:hypothetical protein
MFVYDHNGNKFVLKATRCVDQTGAWASRGAVRAAIKNVREDGYSTMFYHYHDGSWRDCSVGFSFKQLRLGCHLFGRSSSRRLIAWANGK